MIESVNSVHFEMKKYDQRIGRFLSVDPLAAKYPSLSPYNFCANNPILLIDSDGREIIISYMNNKGEIKYFKYGSDIEVPDNKFVQETVNALNHLKTTEVGNSIVSKLESSDKFSVNIVKNNGDASDFGFEPVYSDNKGEIIKEGEKVNISNININSGVLYFDPNQSIKFNDGNLINSSKESSSISPSTALGHELGHAYHAFYLKMSFILNEDDQQFGNAREKFAILNVENKIAKDFGEGIRINHNGSSITTLNSTTNQQMVTPESDEGMQKVEF